MSNEFENILRNKLADAEINTFSQASKAKMWAGISAQTATQGAIGASATQSVLSAKTGSWFSLQFGLFIKSKIVIISLVCASALTGIYMYSSKEDSISEKETLETQQVNASSPEIKQELVFNNSSISNQNQNQNQIHNSPAQLTNNLTPEIIAPEKNIEQESPLQQDNVPTIVDASDNANQDATVPLEENAESQASTIPDTKTHTATDSVVKKTEPVVVKKTVVVENKEVKIVKKKSKYSK